MELIVGGVIAVLAIVGAVFLIWSERERVHTAWMHSVHVQDDCWARANMQATSDAKKIRDLVKANAELSRQNSELCALKLNFAVMQDEILENIRRTLAKEIRPESSTHTTVPADDPSGETRRVTREELQLVGAAKGGNGQDR